MIETLNPISHLREEFKAREALLAAQNTIVQRFLEAQAAQIAAALMDHRSEVRFSLPDQVMTEMQTIGEMVAMSVPANAREQVLGGLKNRVLGQDVKDQLRHRLNELEQSPDRAIASCGNLLRHAAAIHLVHNVLPSGRSINYRAIDDEEIPTLPTADLEPESAITQASDAIAEEGADDDGRGTLQVPYVPAARRWYLPQWVIFDEAGTLLSSSLQEAEAHLASMQRYTEILHIASSLAPYIIADEQYQAKRYGILGQLINQGRELAVYKTRAIIQEIRERAKNGTLNRGLSLSLPYFDDQELRMQETAFQVIPAGRIMFIPAFVVRATREEIAKRAQDTRLNSSTRKYLLGQLKMLEKAFEE